MGREFLPTVAEEAEARLFIGLRLSAISSYRTHLADEVDEAVREVCRIVYRYKGRWVSPSSFSFGSDRLMLVEIEGVIDRLRDALVSMLDEMATLDDEEVEETRQAEMERTMDEDMVKLRREVEALVTCGLLTGIDETHLGDAVVAAMASPWTSTLYKEGREEALKYGTGSDAVIEGVTYGVGHSNVSRHILDITGAAFLTNVFGDKQLAAHPEAKEFISVTADARACDNCTDEERKGWQPIANYSGPWHPNCRCHFYFR